MSVSIVASEKLLSCSVFFSITNNAVGFKGGTGQLGKITFTLNKTSLDESFSAHVSFSSYRYFCF